MIRILSAVLATGLLLSAQSVTSSKGGATPAARNTATVDDTLDLPRIDVLDFYGLHRLSPNLITQALGVRAGSLLPASKGDAEERINQLPQVVASHLEAVCCPGGKTILYVGIEERGAPHYPLRPPPGGADRLPAALVNAYQRILDVSRGINTVTEDLNAGHPLSNDRTLRGLQDQLPPLAAEYFDTLRTVLRQSDDELHRGAAAYILAYSARKADIVDDFHFALTDDDPVVRAIAVRDLRALAALEQHDPASRVRVSAVWFIDLLDSLAWSDRVEAARALEQLTAEHDAFALSRLRQRAQDNIIEMARWQTREHAHAAFVLAGRMADLSEQRIQDAWARGDRESVISALLKRK